MDLHIPSCFSAFHCLAGNCPHTCCADWEVPIDSDTAAEYATLPGPLGVQLRRALRQDEEGVLCFPLKGRFCPFLDEDGLCRIQKELGESHTGLICRTHPRFFNDYGPLREAGLCASCPEAARLVLAEDLTLLAQSTPEIPAEEAPPLLAPLLAARETALRLLRRRSLPPERRLELLLLFSNELQLLLDNGAPEEVQALCALYEETPPESLPPLRPGCGGADCCLTLLMEQEHLRQDWTDLLSEAAHRLSAGTLPAQGPPERLAERAAVYFLYRHWLRAVWDGDALSWGEFVVFATASVCLLSASQDGGGSFPDLLRRFCLETEHSAGNLDLLQDAFCTRFSIGDFLSVIGAIPPLSGRSGTAD